MVTIWVDADGCPVVNQTIQIASKYQLDVWLVCDTSHEYHREGARTLVVSKGRDSADFVLVNRICKNDIVITQDYGLAAMLLAKEATVIHPNGFFYASSTIDKMLFERHLAKEMRRQNRHFHGKIPKRSSEKDLAFLQCLQKALST